MIRIILILTFLHIPFLHAAGGNEDIPKTPVEFSVQLFSHQAQDYLALSYKNFKGWHTYWKNPGDAGLPIRNSFSYNGQPFTLEELEWPTPKKYIEEGNMLAYGYSNDYSLFYKLTPEQKKKISNTSLTIDSKWLVCKHVCIPGKAQIIGKVQGNKFQPTIDSTLKVSSNELNERIQNLPQKAAFPSELDLVLAKGAKDQTLSLYYNLSTKGALKQEMLDRLNLITPFPQSPFDFEREKLHRDKNGHLYGKYNIQWDGEFSEPPIPFPTNGSFKKPFTLKFIFANPLTKKFEIIEKVFPSFSLNAGEKMENFFQLLTPLNKPPSPPNKDGTKAGPIETTTETQPNSLLFYLLFAFIGGLILNIMPCVLPVISLKLFGLIKHSESSRSIIFKHNLFYSLGVLFCFAILAGIVLILKSTGETVGWGFQLQSPTFVASIIIILFIFSLNLFGLFEFQTPGGKALGHMQTGEGYTGDFLSGVLATILSTPCSAPFLGTALTFAFTMGGFTIFGIFMAIGIGLAFPFLLTGIFPKLISFLPKPGNWMNHMKKFLGITLLLTILWLGDVFNSQIENSKSLIQLLIILTLILFAFILRNKLTKNLIANSIAFILPFVLSVHLMSSPLEGSNAKNQDALLKSKQAKGLAWEKWSTEKMQQYKDSGDLVFMDFTAKWCFTCKVNERMVLETNGFHELVKEYNVKLLLADWTKRDEVIGDWLETQGLVGVPAYFVQKKNGELINLGETISLRKIEDHL